MPNMHVGGKTHELFTELNNLQQTYGPYALIDALLTHACPTNDCKPDDIVKHNAIGHLVYHLARTLEQQKERN